MNTAVVSEMGGRQGARKAYVRCDIQLTSNAVAGPFLAQPQGAEALLLSRGVVPQSTVHEGHSPSSRLATKQNFIQQRCS